MKSRKIYIRISERRACREVFFKDTLESILPHFPTDKETVEASDTKWTKIFHELHNRFLMMSRPSDPRARFACLYRSRTSRIEPVTPGDSRYLT